MDISAQLEALLFYRAEPMKINEIARILGISPADAKAAIDVLKSQLADRGVTLVVSDESVALKTAPEQAEFLKTLREEELSKDLGKAGLETLTIVLYMAPVSRNEIDYIRGVNSSFTLRSLSIRGLVERVPNPNDQRSYLYKPTIELLSHLGLTTSTELPDYESIRARLTAFNDGGESTDNESGGAGEGTGAAA